MAGQLPISSSKTVQAQEEGYSHFFGQYSDRAETRHHGLTISCASGCPDAEENCISFFGSTKRHLFKHLILNSIFFASEPKPVRQLCNYRASNPLLIALRTPFGNSGGATDENTTDENVTTLKALAETFATRLLGRLKRLKT